MPSTNTKVHSSSLRTVEVSISTHLSWSWLHLYVRTRPCKRLLCAHIGPNITSTPKSNSDGHEKEMMWMKNLASPNSGTQGRPLWTTVPNLKALALKLERSLWPL